MPTKRRAREADIEIHLDFSVTARRSRLRSSYQSGSAIKRAGHLFLRVKQGSKSFFAAVLESNCCKKSTRYEKDLNEWLKDPDDAAGYLTDLIEEGDKDAYAAGIAQGS